MPNALRTASPEGTWHSFRFTCTESGGMLGQRAAYAAGLSWLYMIQNSVGMLIEDVANGDEGVLIYQAEKIMVAKKHTSVDVFLPGDTVYWDPADGLVTPVYDTGLYRIGVATEPALGADYLVEIDLDGGPAVAGV
jgi:hypothetical protein